MYNCSTMLGQNSRRAQSRVFYSNQWKTGQGKRSEPCSLNGTVKLLLPLATFAFVLVMLFPAAALRIFTTDPAVITMGVQYLRCNSWDFLLTAVYFCMNSLITGSGHTAFVMVNDCLCSVLVRIPTSILLAQTFHMGIAGMGLAAPAATLVGLLAALVFIQGGFWRRNAIQHQEHVVLENEI